MKTRRCTKAGLAASLTLPLLAAAVWADDWPQWRGLNRDGVWNETGILKSFPPDGLKVRWRAPVGWGILKPCGGTGAGLSHGFAIDAPQVRGKNPLLRRGDW